VSEALPIRIAFVVNRFDVGGLERYVSRMCNHLPHDRFETELICLRSAGNARHWLDPSKVVVHELNAAKGNDRKLVKQLRELILSRGFDIVQSHNWGTLLETYFACNRLRSKVKHIHAERGTVLGPDCTTKWKRVIRSLAMRFILPRVCGTVCNAYAIKNKIRQATGLDRIRIEVIPNGLELSVSDREIESMRNTTRGGLGFDNNTLVVGFLGRFAPVKNPGLVIDAFRQVLQTPGGMPKRNIKLLMVGDGQLLDDLRNKVISCGMEDSVVFPGEQTDSLQWLASMDVLVNSSRSEGMSQAILEGMALGVPLIVTDVGDSKLLVREGKFEPACGSSIASDDPGALADEIIRFCKSPALRSEFSRNARQRFDRWYSLKTMLDRYQEYYTSMVRNAT
jgi:glycosyltransferase involved in cell wall biosynthesis